MPGSPAGGRPFRLLFIGDIVGKPGLDQVERLLPGLKRDRELDFVVANAENIASGSGITPVLFERLLACGVDVVTLGDHVTKKNEIYPVLEKDPRLIRPLNFPEEFVGRGYTVVESAGGVPVAVVSLLGRIYLPPIDCPFVAVEKLLPRLKEKAEIVVVELHAEATSEKKAMGWFLDGQITALIGTHTHVPTADAEVLPRGTGYITDIGMTGPVHSILGRRVDRVLTKFRTGMPSKFDVAEGACRMGTVLLEILHGKTVRIKQEEFTG